MNEPIESNESNDPAVAWRLLLAGVAIAMILVALAVQWSQETVIPPLVVLPILFVVGLVLLVLRPRLGSIVIGALAVLMILGNLPFLVEDITHPESFGSFVPTGIGVLAGLVGLAALVAVLRRVDGRPAGILGAVGLAGAVAVIALSAVQSGGQEDDAPQEGDQHMFAQDIEFKPPAFEAPAGDIGIYIGNDDLVRHNLSIDDLDVDEELPAKAFVRIAITGAEPGEYEYYCDIDGHEDMIGTLTVT